MINGAHFQINTIPFTFQAGFMEDFRYSGHHFVEAVRNVNKLQFSNNLASLGLDLNLYTGVEAKLAFILMKINVSLLCIKYCTNLDVRSVWRYIRSDQLSIESSETKRSPVKGNSKTESDYSSVEPGYESRPPWAQKHKEIRPEYMDR